MSRAAVPGLASRHPLGARLPALYAVDDFAQRFTAGLDVVLAPVFATLDNLSGYLSPRLAPADFLEWLGSWVDAELDPGWPLPLRRAVVATAVELHRWRGTAYGLGHRLWLCAGVRSRVLDAPGAVTSSRPGRPMPGPRPAQVRVQVWPERRGAPVDVARVHRLVALGCPLHVRYRVEVLDGPPDGPPGNPSGNRPAATGGPR